MAVQASLPAFAFSADTVVPLSGAGHWSSRPFATVSVAGSQADEQSVYTVFTDRILAELIPASLGNLDVNTERYLSQLTSDGGFPDIDYKATDRTNWPPLQHITRMLEMAKAYTFPESKYYGSAELKATLDRMLAYWHQQQPRSNNWYQNEIGEPQNMGRYLILMQRLGKEPIPADLFEKSITRLRTKGGDPAKQNGANRVDVALHWMYRACLTEDAALLRQAMDYIYSTIVYTTGSEGIQYDHSFTQHGRQLHLGGYGDVFLDGITKACSYAAGTDYKLEGEKLDILAGLADAYMRTLRGQYQSHNAMGRSSTRPHTLRKTGATAIWERMKALNPSEAQTYDDFIARMSGTVAPSYAVQPRSTHFYKTDYTLHQRPDFTVDLRMVSKRTARNEYLKDNGEGIKQYFLSDGSMSVLVNGNEYYDIFPVWNYAKIPGVTCPEFENIPQANTYIKMGQSSFVGGVTDSLYAVSVYQYKDNEYGVNSSARKAWFFFDREVVCLGNSIQSTSDYQVNTTVNQCLLDGDVTVSAGGTETVLQPGEYDYADGLDWVQHDSVAYFFPQKGQLQLSAGEKSGFWTDINTSYTQEGEVKKDVFTLSFNHGKQPTSGEYAYIIVPGLTDAASARSYPSSDIEIVVNSDSVQAVYHRGLKVYGIVFHRASNFRKHDLAIEADAGCVVLVKDADRPEAVVHVSDPSASGQAIHLGIEIPALEGRRQFTYEETSPYQGRSARFLINEDTPLSGGRDILSDRAGWTVTTELPGAKDESVLVGGDKPKNLIDRSVITSFLFVKPGMSEGGVTAPADYEPSFTIDMQEPSSFNYITYRHRDYKTTDASLRAGSVTLLGKQAEGDEFELIASDLPLDIAETENLVRLSETATCRYLKVVLGGYDPENGTTVQVSDFNVGLNVMDEIPESGVPSGITGPVVSDSWSVTASPRVVRRGQPVRLQVSAGDAEGLSFRVYGLSGRLMEQGRGSEVSTGALTKGVYLLQVRDDSRQRSAVVKLLVR